MRQESFIWNLTNRKTTSVRPSTSRKPTSFACKSKNVRKRTIYHFQLYGKQPAIRLQNRKPAVIPTNIFKKGSCTSCLSRKYPIHINYGYSDTDSICIKLPDGYIVEGLPKPIDLKSKFGNFHSSIYTKDNKIYIVHQLFMRKGVYKPGEYTAFLDFRKQVAEQYNGKIILKKE